MLVNPLNLLVAAFRRAAWPVFSCHWEEKGEKCKCFEQLIFSLVFALFTVSGFDGHYRQAERRNSQEWQVS